MCTFLLIRKKRTALLNILFCIIFIDCFLPTSLIFNQLTRNNPEIYFLTFSFAYGAFLAINSRKLSIKSEVVLISFLSYFAFKNTAYTELLLIISFCNLVIYIASRKFILKLKPKFDVSYGIYLWGFLTQQIVYFIFGQMYAGLHFILALILSAGIAYVSFIYIEKPFVILGKKASTLCILKYNTFLEKKLKYRSINN